MAAAVVADPGVDAATPSRNVAVVLSVLQPNVAAAAAPVRGCVS
jgi:hypothetical protein